LLAGGEDQIRAMSKATVEASGDLSLHAQMIRAACPCSTTWQSPMRTSRRTT
jgi:hypothetical protein